MKMSNVAGQPSGGGYEVCVAVVAVIGTANHR